MNLQFKEEFRSIKQFESVELNNFSILTGINGSGKTHLLNSLKNGHSQIDSIDKKNIVFFDFIQFKIENEGAFTKEQVTSERQGAWNYFEDEENRNSPRIKQNLLKIKNNNFDDANRIKIKELAQEKGKFLFSLDDDDFTNEENLKNSLLQYKDDIQDYFSQENLINNQNAQGIYALSKKLSFFIVEISESTFMNSYVPTVLKENFLPTQLGRIFLDYRVKEYEEFHKYLEDPSEQLSNREELKIKAQTKCKKMYGGSEPWQIINDFLNAYGNFRYRITFPDEFTTESYSYQTRTTFTPVLYDSTTDLSISYQNLSSGEQILFALALCMFKGKSDNVFPQLLLLDEIDATLHPSMIGNMLNVIQEVFLKKGTKVVLATHSPTTIALTPEKTIFVVNKSGNDRIEKSDKKRALQILTEGYMTMEEGIQLIDQISNKELSIISEGKNIEYLKKASEFFAGTNIEKIDIITGVEGRTGKNQLKTLFDFFTKVNHERKIVIVWDCDFTKSVNEENNTFPFVFARNTSNNIAPDGIENLFDESLFDGYTIKKIDSRGNESTFFDSNRKNDFLKHVIEIAKPEIFENFKPLFEYFDTKLNSE